MIRRELPRSEWAKLAGTELEAVVPHLPDSARVLVVEDGDQIVGCWCFVSLIHAEGVWTAETHRGRSSVARHLLAGMREIVTDMGAQGVITAAMDDTVRGFCTALGATELPGTHYAMPLERT
jgi:hypothetical protein